MADQYLIRKGGAYYRPNAAGYTMNVAEAGRYTLDEAILHSHPNGPNGPRDGIDYMPAPPAEPARTTPHAELVEAARDALEALEGVDRLLHAHGMMVGASCPAIEPLRRALSLYGGEKP